MQREPSTKRSAGNPHKRAPSRIAPGRTSRAQARLQVPLQTRATSTKVHANGRRRGSTQRRRRLQRGRARVGRVRARRLEILSLTHSRRRKPTRLLVKMRQMPGTHCS